MAIQKILLVDDSKTELHHLSELLTRNGFSVRTAENGDEAMRRLAAETPDLILMDVALGDMDGWEATRLIKSNPGTRQIPIIALTAHALASDRDTSVKVGCADFDTKPVDLPRLLGKIRGCLAA